MGQYTQAEEQLIQAVESGAWVDLRVGNDQADAPEGGAVWGEDRTVHADVLRKVLIGEAEVAARSPRAVRLSGARISGPLDLAEIDLGCPVALVHCYFDDAVTLRGAVAVSVRLSGSHLPSLDARLLETRGDLDLDAGFTTKTPADSSQAKPLVDLRGAHIGGTARLSGGKFDNRQAPAVNADGIRVDQDMLCAAGFEAHGEVRMVGAHIGGQLNCTGGKFQNSTGPAISADTIVVDGGMYCRAEAQMADEVQARFEATGEVSLIGARIGSQLACQGGRFLNPTGRALGADGIQVASDLILGDGFEAAGEVRLMGAHVGGQLDCKDGTFNVAQAEDQLALTIREARVDEVIIFRPKVFVGRLDLRDASVNHYADAWDHSASHPSIRLDGFAYQGLSPELPAAQRCEWLRHNMGGYTGEIYDQLAAAYRRAGSEGEARAVGIAKHRARRKQVGLLGKIWSYGLDVTVGFGYRTWLAFFWLAGFLIAGSAFFQWARVAQLLTAAKTGAAASEQPDFQAFTYTVDWLVPVLGLHQREFWVPHGCAVQLMILLFAAIGWLLTTAVVLSITGVLKRD